MESFTELSYLLAFVQLTWQVDNGWFSPVFMIFSWNSLILGQYILGDGRKGRGGGVGGGKSLIKEEMTQIVEFRVAMTCTCTYKGPIFHYKTWTEVH